VLHANNAVIVTAVNIPEYIFEVYLTCTRLVPAGIISAVESSDLAPGSSNIWYEVTLGDLLMIYVINNLA